MAQEKHRLTAKQEEFARQYAAGEPGVLNNATRAAIEAGYSERTAAQIGHENLRKPHVRARVEELREEAREVAKVRLVDWWLLAPEHQRTLHLVALGRGDEVVAHIEDPKLKAEALRQAVRAALHTMDRVQGTLKQMHEWSVAQETRDAMIPVYVVGGPTADEDA